MNKNHLNSSINNYLTNSSLFKNNQKNRLVSSYVSHRNYFAEQESPRTHKEVYIPNVTKSKKQQNQISNDNIEPRIIQQNKADALQATVKKDVSNQPFLQQRDKPIKAEPQLPKIRSELPSIKQSNQEAVVNQHERLKEKQQEREKQRQREIERQLQRQRQRQIQKQKQRQRELERQRQREKQREREKERERQRERQRERELERERERERQREREREREREWERQKKLLQSNEQSKSKIIVYYTQKGKGRKLQDKDIEDLNRQMSNTNQIQNNQYNHKYMQYNKNQEQQQNPYLPTTQKKQKQTRKQPSPNNLSLKKSNSIHSSSSVVRQMPNQSQINNKSGQKRRQAYNGNEQTDYMINIRKDMNGYLASIKEKLNHSYICLETVEYDFQSQIQKALQMQCQKLKIVLYGLIDEQINGFKQFERRQFVKSKFYFMSELYEIKCNIDLRLEQIEHYQLQLKNEYKWKEFANNILGINYNEHINFILKKSDQIQNELASNVHPQLNHYAKSINEQFVFNIRRAIKEQFAKVYENFDKNKFKSTSFGGKEP